MRRPAASRLGDHLVLAPDASRSRTLMQLWRTLLFLHAWRGDKARGVGTVELNCSVSAGKEATNLGMLA